MAAPASPPEPAAPIAPPLAEPVVRSAVPSTPLPAPPDPRFSDPLAESVAPPTIPTPDAPVVPTDSAAPASFAEAPPTAPLTDRDFDQLPPPPFQRSARGRRNPARMWTMIAAAVAVLLVGATAALAWFGVPDSVARLMPFAPAAQPDLVIELPQAAQDHRTLADGTIYFSAAGTIINPTDRAQRVPPILAELRDAQGRIVYSWTIRPPVRSLPAGERVAFSEAKVDIPRAAVMLTASWAPER